MRGFLRSVRRWGLLVLVLAVLLAGCGAMDYVSKTYPLESANQSGGGMQKVYRAENKSVPEVARELREQEAPEEVSKESAQEMFLVYRDRLIHLQQDPERPQDTLIEIDDNQFVKEHYDPSFLEGFLLASTLDRIFGGGWHFGGGSFGHYRGYRWEPHAPAPPPASESPGMKKPPAEPPKTVAGTGSFTRRTDLPSANPPQTETVRSGGESSKTAVSAGDRPSRSVSSPPKVSKGSTGSFTRRR
ncbi:MAG: DUF4247 domain-containing protein [Alicyclobacillaceae bacterium]|nr:DUF4247 domain-containing protein [Alicyclobacillaceae bacterium]